MYLILTYLLTSIFCVFIFAIYDVERGQAFIPVYNVYKVYKLYNGRVYQRKWHEFYLAYIVLGSLFIFIFGLFASAPIISDRSETTYLIILIISMLVAVVFNVLFDILLLYPLMYNKNMMRFFIVYIILSILFDFYKIYYLLSLDIFNNYATQSAKFDAFKTKMDLLSLIFYVLDIIIVFICYQEITKGKLTIVSDLGEISKYTLSETIDKLKLRNKKLFIAKNSAE